jgi:hypothetical protein
MTQKSATTQFGTEKRESKAFKVNKNYATPGPG